jgi:hypothetical protein
MSDIIFYYKIIKYKTLFHCNWWNLLSYCASVDMRLLLLLLLLLFYFDNKISDKLVNSLSAIISFFLFVSIK